MVDLAPSSTGRIDTSLSARGRVTSSAVFTWLGRHGLPVAVILLVLYPIVTLVSRPLPELSRLWQDARSIDSLGETIGNTLLLAVTSVTVSLVIGTTLAYLVVRLPRRLQAIGVALAALPILVPPVAAGVGWAFMLSPTVGYGNQWLRSIVGGDTGPLNIYSLWGIILLPTMYLAPYVFLFVWTALRNLDMATVDAARISGASWWRTQRAIVLPAIRPALLYSSVIVLLQALGQFLFVLLYGRNDNIDVITTVIYRMVLNYPSDLTLAAFLGLPLLVAAILLVWVQNRAAGRLTTYASVSKGVRDTERSARWPLIPVLGYAFLATGPPLLGLIIGALSPFWSQNIDTSAFTFANFTFLWEDGRVRDAVQNSVVFAGAGTVLSLGLVAAIAGYLLRVERGPVRAVLDLVVNLPLGLPAVLFGFAILLSFAAVPFPGYGSGLLFVIAYFILVLPMGTRLLLSGLSQISRDLSSAARVAGAGPWRTVRAVTFPLIRRSVASAGFLMFVVMVNEFAAAAMVATNQNQVMTTQLYAFWEGGQYPQVAAMSLAMFVVTGVGGLTIFLVLAGRGARRRPTKAHTPSSTTTQKEPSWQR